MSNLTLAGLSGRVGQELGVSEWVTIDQPRIDTFASCTGDRQWIHVDVERAKRESPFRGPVAHGYLALAMVAPLSMEVGVTPRTPRLASITASTRSAFWRRCRPVRA